MIPELSHREAEAMDPQVYASMVTGDDYAEYAERTEAGPKAFNERIFNRRTAVVIREALELSKAAGAEMDCLKRFLFYGKPLPDAMQAWWESGSPVAISSESDQGLAVTLADLKIQRLLHVGAGLQTEASEFNDALFNHIFNGARLDTVNLAEELGDSCWYIGIGCRVLGITIMALMRNNIAKLFMRFRGKFCYERVSARDLAGERAVLEDLK